MKGIGLWPFDPKEGADVSTFTQEEREHRN